MSNYHASDDQTLTDARRLVAEATADRVTWGDGTEYIAVEDAVRLLAARAGKDAAAVAAARERGRADLAAKVKAVIAPMGDPADPEHLHPQAASLLVQLWDVVAQQDDRKELQ